MTVFTNANLVLDHEIVRGHLAIHNGRIAAIGEGAATGEDCEGDFLIPGLIELHTDHLEGHVSPRPRVKWNTTAAIQAHDAQIAASGITTVLDALRVGLSDNPVISTKVSRELADDIAGAQAVGRLRADHRFHLRCEVSDATAMPDFALFEDCDGVVLVSLMDHTPGQRQFRSLDAYRAYFQGKNGMSDEAFERFQAERKATAAIWSDRNRRELAERARAKGYILASHDDATADHVNEAIRDGVTLAEFPTTIEAAQSSRAAGMRVLMGGPNLVLGGSHSGNVSVGELADAGALDILSSDYVPFSMLQGAFLLGEREGWSLPRAISTVTAAPAATIGLTDRGRLAQGLRADLALVRRSEPDDVPVVRGVWREGRRVL